jgi:hypothetical protein
MYFCDPIITRAASTMHCYLICLLFLVLHTPQTVQRALVLNTTAFQSFNEGLIKKKKSCGYFKFKNQIGHTCYNQ